MRYLGIPAASWVSPPVGVTVPNAHRPFISRIFRKLQTIKLLCGKASPCHSVAKLP
jgi:hypothetical protein